MLLSLLLLYTVVWDLLSGEVVFLNRFGACLVQGIFVPCLIIRFLKINSFLNRNFENLMIGVALVGCAITILMIIYPPFDAFINSIHQSNEEFYEQFENSVESRYRMYGLAESLTFTYPYVIAVIALYTFSERKIYLSIPLLLMTIIVVSFNARIAFIPLLLSLVYLFAVKQKNVKSLIGSTIAIVAFVVIWLNVIPTLGLFQNEWGFSFFDEMVSYFTTGESRTMSTLTGSMFFLPDESAFTLLFGTGISAYHIRNYSDVGYIIQLYYGGIIFLLLILYTMYYMPSRLIKRLGFSHWFAFIFLFSIFILNFKGFYFSSIPGFRFFMLLYCYYLLIDYYKNKSGVYYKMKRNC